MNGRAFSRRKKQHETIQTQTSVVPALPRHNVQEKNHHVSHANARWAADQYWTGVRPRMRKLPSLGPDKSWERENQSLYGIDSCDVLWRLISVQFEVTCKLIRVSGQADRRSRMEIRAYCPFSPGSMGEEQLSLPLSDPRGASGVRLAAARSLKAWENLPAWSFIHALGRGRRGKMSRRRNLEHE